MQVFGSVFEIWVQTAWQLNADLEVTYGYRPFKFTQVTTVCKVIKKEK